MYFLGQIRVIIRLQHAVAYTDIFNERGYITKLYVSTYFLNFNNLYIIPIIRIV